MTGRSSEQRRLMIANIEGYVDALNGAISFITQLIADDEMPIGDEVTERLEQERAELAGEVDLLEETLGHLKGKQ